MTPEEMIAHCQKQQELQGQLTALVTFVMPGVLAGEARHLFGRTGPIGKVVATTRQTSTVAFRADEVIQALRGEVSSV